MKSKKYIICSGLAFSDQKDMEILHNYALDGWIFRKLKFGVLYELHKEEPQNVVFSYDLQKIKKEEKDDYLAFFEESGWQLVGNWISELHFFMAKEGTVPVHSETTTRAQQYKSMFIISIVMIVLGLLCVYATVSIGGIWFAACAGGLLAGGTTMTIACYSRMKGKKGNLNTRSYSYYFIELCLGIIFLICYIRMWDTDSIMLFVLAVSLWFIIGSLHGFYRVYKEHKMKERIQS